MIPRLNRSNPIVPRRPVWPEWPQRGQRLAGTLFEERPPLRRLIILADPGLLASPDVAAVDQKVLLTGLLTHPYVELVRFSDEGPPPGAPRRETEPSVSLRSAAEGWAELQAPDGTDMRGVVYAASSGVGYTAIWGDRPEIARRDASSSAYADLAPVIWRGAAGSGNFNMNEGLYFWVGTRELLPAAWRWFTACVQQSDPTGDRTLLELGESLLRRVQRALEARDRLHRAFNLPQNNDTASAVLSELDSILVSLMGAVDVSARVAHLVLGITGSVRDAGWQNGQRWLPRVVTAEPALAVLFNADTVHSHVLTILRLMRNTVHGQMIRSIALHRPGRMLETAIVLPADTGDEVAILSAMDALGGRGSWGASAGPYRWLVDPGVFTEQLLPRIVTMLNEIMETTPVERLSQVRLTQADCQPPAPDPAAGRMDTFSERSRLSIRWQLGL